MSAPPTANFERSLYIGNAFAGILYGMLKPVKRCSAEVAQNTTGIQMYMVFHSTYLLLNSRSGYAWKSRMVKFYVIYGFVMLILTTFAMAANQLMGQFMWIEHRNYPGGPFNYYLENSTLWINVFGTTACIVGNYLNDALLVLRIPLISSVVYFSLIFFFFRFTSYIVYTLFIAETGLWWLLHLLYF